jgi:hypothetical protein
MDIALALLIGLSDVWTAKNDDHQTQNSTSKRNFQKYTKRQKLSKNEYTLYSTQPPIKERKKKEIHQVLFPVPGIEPGALRCSDCKS